MSEPVIHSPLASIAGLTMRDFAAISNAASTAAASSILTTARGAAQVRVQEQFYPGIDI